MLSLCFFIYRSMRVTSLKTKKPLNLEKTTSSVLSVLLLIYDSNKWEN